MKKITLISIIVVLLIGILLPQFTYASSIKDDLGELEEYRNQEGNIGALENKAETVIGIIRTVGITISVVALILIGLKYMLGSVEEKAEYKKTLIPYLIGAFLVFTVSLLPQIIYDIMKGFE